MPISTLRPNYFLSALSIWTIIAMRKPNPPTKKPIEAIAINFSIRFNPRKGFFTDIARTRLASRLVSSTFPAKFFIFAISGSFNAAFALLRSEGFTTWVMFVEGWRLPEKTFESL